MDPQNSAGPRPWTGQLNRETVEHVAALIDWGIGQGRYSAAVFTQESGSVSLVTGMEAKIKGHRGEEEVRVRWQAEPCAYITWEDVDRSWVLDASIYAHTMVTWDGLSLIFRLVRTNRLLNLKTQGLEDSVDVWILTPERDPKWKSVPEARVREMMNVLAMATRLSPYTRGVADALAWFLGEMDDATMHYKYMHEGGEPEVEEMTDQERLDRLEREHRFRRSRLAASFKCPNCREHAARVTGSHVGNCAACEAL